MARVVQLAAVALTGAAAAIALGLLACKHIVDGIVPPVPRRTRR